MSERCPRHRAHGQRRGGARARRCRARRWSISCARISASPAAMSAASTACAAPARCGVDGVIVRGCLMLAVQCDGAGSRPSRACRTPARSPTCRQAFEHATRCNAASARPACCSPRRSCWRSGGVPSREEIREHLSGNYCRCTGYQAIVDAVESVAQARARRQADEDHRRRPLRAHRARPAELLHRPLGAAAEPGAAHARAAGNMSATSRCRAWRMSPSCARRTRMRASRRSTTAAAKNAPGVIAVVTGAELAEGDHAVGRRAHPSQGHQVGAAARDRGRSRLLAGRGGVRRGGAHARARPRTPASWSRSTTRSCPPSPTPRPRSMPARR